MEQVLVVPTSAIRSSVQVKHRGLSTQGADELMSLVAECGCFRNRDDVETDPAFKQIIPYACVRYRSDCFVLRRKSKQGEQRLHDKLSIGVGGHINPSSNMLGLGAIADGLHREVNEELEIAAGYGTQLIGLVNDETTEVGRVHLGVLFEITPTTRLVDVRERDKMSGGWVPIEELRQCFAALETWSQIVCEEHLFL